MSDEATPRPWLVTDVYSGAQTVAIMRSTDRQVCINAPTEDPRPYESTDANARLIVRAVNAHEALVEALRAIVALAADWDEDGALGPRPPLSWESVARLAMDEARAALALAEEAH